MPKLKDLHILVTNENDKIDFTTPVSVTKDGIFTTTLPNHAYNELGTYGLAMRKNRIGNPGYFEAKTLEALEKELTDFAKECISRELVENILVIKYEINTQCYYIKDEDGETVPNGRWCKNHKAFDEGKAIWKEGNAVPPGRTCTPSFSAFARVYHKKTYQYQSGKKVINYERYDPAYNGRTTNPNDWINGLCNIGAHKETGLFGQSLKDEDLARMPEVEATEENGRFFVTIFKMLFKMNELFSEFNQPGAVELFLKNNTLPQLTL